MPMALNASKVREIRRLREKGLSISQLSKRFGVTDATIKRVLRRLTWVWVRWT